MREAEEAADVPASLHRQIRSSGVTGAPPDGALDLPLTSGAACGAMASEARDRMTRVTAVTPSKAAGVGRRAAAAVTVFVVFAWLVGSFAVVASWTSRGLLALRGSTSFNGLYECLREQIQALPKEPTFIPLDQNGEFWYQRASEFATNEFPLVTDETKADRLLIIGLAPGGPCNGWAIVTVPR